MADREQHPHQKPTVRVTSAAQQRSWDQEYRTQQLLSPSLMPQADVVRFVRWLKKEHKKHHDGAPFEFEALFVLDLGSGTGRNALYFAEQGSAVHAYEFAPTALYAAREHAAAADVPITFALHDIGEPYPLPSESIDIALDVTSSNSLSDAGRATYLSEVHRVLKPGGLLFLRALSFEGDPHAKELVRRSPGADPDTYIHPDLGITEKVFSRESLHATYGPYFTFRQLERVQHYATVAGRTYKRSYWIAYLQKSGAEPAGE
jgi:SAM-dependent methyltransferase